MNGPGLSRNDALRLGAVIVIWGLNFVVMKVGLKGLSPMLLGALRFVVAAAPFLFVARPGLPARYVIGYGLAQGLGQFGLLFLGLKLGMPAGMASLVIQTQAFFTLLIGMFVLHERCRPAQWLGLAVALAGLVAIAAAHGSSPGEMTLIGFLLTVGAAFMWACANVLGRLAARVHDYEPVNFIVWTSLVPVLPFFALACGMDGVDSVLTQLRGIDLTGFLAVLFLGLLSTLLAYSLWTQLLKKHPAAKVAPWSLLVPVVGMSAAAVAFGERPQPLQWVGALLVLAGLVINQGGAWFRR
ncbi:EamA family transporter [Burkholderiaceae bacterium UC74_6]